MKILLTEPLIEPVDNAGLDILRKVGTVIIASGTSEESLIKEAKDADAIVVRLAKITGRIIENTDRLKVIARTGVGVDNIDVAAATKKRVMVVNLPVMNTDSVAEHALCLILAMAKNLIEFDREVRKGNWGIRDRLLPKNIDLIDKTLGIVGLGTIGIAVARKAKGLNMRVLYQSRRRKADLEKELGIEYTDLPTLLKEADFITVHIALSKETERMFGEKEFKTMKKTAYFINTSRGGVVDQKALYSALEDGRIAGAALDVFEEEPIKATDPILKLQNLIVTPHVAGHTRDSRIKMIVVLAEDVVRALNGKTPVNLVNKDVLR
ncbi:MAG: hydroxyacid dehydrogenase [Candidatus Bathyarchaeia archaeon]